MSYSPRPVSVYPHLTKSGYDFANTLRRSSNGQTKKTVKSLIQASRRALPKAPLASQKTGPILAAHSPLPSTTDSNTPTTPLSPETDSSLPSSASETPSSPTSSAASSASLSESSRRALAEFQAFAESLMQQLTTRPAPLAPERVEPVASPEEDDLARALGWDTSDSEDEIAPVATSAVASVSPADVARYEALSDRLAQLVTVANHRGFLLPTDFDEENPLHAYIVELQMHVVDALRELETARDNTVRVHSDNKYRKRATKQVLETLQKYREAVAAIGGTKSLPEQFRREYAEFTRARSPEWVDRLSVPLLPARPETSSSHQMPARVTGASADPRKAAQEAERILRGLRAHEMVIANPELGEGSETLSEAEAFLRKNKMDLTSYRDSLRGVSQDLRNVRTAVSLQRDHNDAVREQNGDLSNVKRAAYRKAVGFENRTRNVLINVTDPRHINSAEHRRVLQEAINS